MTRSCLTNNLRCSPWRQFPFRNHDPHLHTTQRTHDVKVTSSLRENEIATSFWRNSDVIFGSCVRWESASRALYLRSYIFRTSIAWVARSGGHVFPKSLITAAMSKHSSSRSLMTRHWIYPSRKRIHGSVGFFHVLTHWGRVTHICVGNLTIIGPDNGLSPGRRQAIIWTNAGILLIGPWGTNFSEILIGIQTFSVKKMHLKMSSAKWRPFCLGLNVLIRNGILMISQSSTITKNGLQKVIPYHW